MSLNWHLLTPVWSLLARVSSGQSKSLCLVEKQVFKLYQNGQSGDVPSLLMGISFFLSSYRRLILWSWAHPSQKRFPFLGFSRELLFSTVRMTFYQVNGFRLVPGHDQNRRDCYEQGSPYSERVCSWNDGHCQHRNTVKMTAFSVTYIGTILSGKEQPRYQLR